MRKLRNNRYVLFFCALLLHVLIFVMDGWFMPNDPAIPSWHFFVMGLLGLIFRRYLLSLLYFEKMSDVSATGWEYVPKTPVWTILLTRMATGMLSASSIYFFPIGWVGRGVLWVLLLWTWQVRTRPGSPTNLYKWLNMLKK